MRDGGEETGNGDATGSPRGHRARAGAFNAGAVAYLKSLPDAACLLKGIADIAANEALLRTTSRGVIASEHFDAAYHFRWEQLPGRVYLERTIEARLAAPLAQHRPPWELHCFVLPDGAVLLLKATVALDREVGGSIKLLGRLAEACDAREEVAASPLPDLTALPFWALDQARSAIEGLASPLARLRQAASSFTTPDLLLARAREASLVGTTLAQHALQAARSLGMTLGEKTPHPEGSGLGWPQGGRRRFGAIDLPLGALEAVGATIKASLGTMVLAGTSSALAQLEIQRGGAVPALLAARVGLPYLGTTDLMLPLGDLSPLDRAQRIHTSITGRMLERDQPLLGAIASGLTFVPRALSWLAKPLFEGPSLALSIRIEDESPGPQTIAGATIERLYPIVGSASACALTIGALAQQRSLSLSFTVDEEALPQPELLASALRQSFAELCASQPARGH